MLNDLQLNSKSLDELIFQFLLKSFDPHLSSISSEAIIEGGVIFNSSYSDLVAILGNPLDSDRIRINGTIMEDNYIFQVSLQQPSSRTLLYDSRYFFDEGCVDHKIFFWKRGTWEEQVLALNDKSISDKK